MAIGEVKPTTTVQVYHKCYWPLFYQLRVSGSGFSALRSPQIKNIFGNGLV